MKPSPGRNTARWKHPSPACSGGAAPAPPLGSRTSPATFSPPSSHAVPRGTFLATPAPLPGRPGLRPPGGAREGRERPREARPPAPGPRASTQSARPAPPVSTRPTRPGAPPDCDPTSPRSQVYPASAFPVVQAAAGANPAAPRPRKQKQAAGPGRSRRAARGHSPGRPGAARVPPERCPRPTPSAAMVTLGLPCGETTERSPRKPAVPAPPPPPAIRVFTAQVL
ncbi:basic proline-rich protein-like [Sus scrofa]|uniref:basic proline-rich protein-like n=1 Tax=Sus scrofa TaxID=9823 RepID=UPI000A2B643D|nr:basic proline-rich protein-like [Sus scrofa]